MPSRRFLAFLAPLASIPVIGRLLASPSSNAKPGALPLIRSIGHPSGPNRGGDGQEKMGPIKGEVATS